MLETLGDWLIHLTALGSLLFVLTYGSITSWWRTTVGRAFMAMVVSLLLIFGLASITLLFGTHWPVFPRAVIRLVIGSITCSAIWIQLAVLIRSQLKPRSQRVE